jgi:hypothetical protein
MAEGKKTMEITKEQFLDYEAVRLSGVTNMTAMTLIEELSGLSHEQIFEIMKRHDELKKKYTTK